MKAKPMRIFTTLLAVMLCMAAFSVTALAANEKTATTSAASTPDGTGTVVSESTNEDGKEFLTITTPNKHVFYLIIDKQKGSENVYFLDAVTEKDLLALAQSDGEGSDSSSVSTAATTSEPTSSPAVSTPVSSETSQPVKQNSTAEITAVILLSAVIAGGAIWFFKFRKPKASAKGKKNTDEYDFLTDEDEEYETEDEPELKAPESEKPEETDE